MFGWKLYKGCLPTTTSLAYRGMIILLVLNMVLGLRLFFMLFRAVIWLKKCEVLVVLSILLIALALWLGCVNISGSIIFIYL